MPAQLQLRLLGKPQSSIGGAPVAPFVYNKTLALLTYLVVTGRGHSREALAGLLWGDLREESARANLRKILSDLRQALPDHLAVTRQTVAFDCSVPHWLDVDAFQLKLQSLRVLAEPAVFHESEVRLLGEAVDLYGGDFMEGFYVRDAPGFEEWVLVQRERLRQLALQALHLLAKHFTARGRYAEGITHTNRLLALEPWHEEYHQQMMLLLALSGQRSAALHQYEICRSILAKDLDVEPSADTVLLFQQIRAGKIIAPSAIAAPPHNLVSQVTPFIGREEELRAISQRLHEPDCRLLTLVGISGTGKTRLALQAAHDVLPSFPDGVYGVHVPARCSSDLLISTILESLGQQAEFNSDARARLLEYLRNRRMLLLLDNIEELTDGTELLADIIARAPGVKLLVTSLERLNMPGEWMLRIGGLDFPASEYVDGVADYAALRLFLAGAQRVHPGFSLTEAETPGVVRICQLVDGLPLALELAAAWVRMLSGDEIADEIEHNIDFLETVSGSVPPRQRSLRAVFNHSWSQLSNQEQEVFCRLSVFRGGFRRDAAQQVAGATLPTLAALVDRSLLQTNSFGRYDMHAFVRRYCAEKLAERPDQLVETRQRHCGYYAGFLQKRKIDLAGPHRSEGVDELCIETENLQAACEWTLERTLFQPVDWCSGDAASAMNVLEQWQASKDALTTW